MNFDVDVYIDSIRNKSISRMRTRLREYDFDNKINNGDKEINLKLFREMNAGQEVSLNPIIKY